MLINPSVNSPGEVSEGPGGAGGDGLVLGLRQALEHGDGAPLPQGALVPRAAGGEVPEAEAGVGHDGDGGGLELLQQDAQKVVLAKDGPGMEEGTDSGVQYNQHLGFRVGTNLGATLVLGNGKFRHF